MKPRSPFDHPCARKGCGKPLGAHQSNVLGHLWKEPRDADPRRCWRCGKHRLDHAGWVLGHMPVYKETKEKTG
ncbi:hypothetical protein [Streptomyces albidoflavus]|uniref:hypothetical protein n=1 Tax=Streptomyces albidoflavus TaxID=1886 RepID=UPI003330EA04